jgi:hypothetical protein
MVECARSLGHKATGMRLIPVIGLEYSCNFPSMRAFAINETLQIRLPERMINPTMDHHADRQLFQYHPLIGYTFIPGLKARIRHEAGGYLVKVNHAGFRCEHEFISEKSPGKKRVLLFGNSFTAGDGVSNQYRYGDVLETLIPNLEVYNFGMPGTGTDQQYLIFREMVADFEYDLIVLGVLVENIRRVTSRYRMSTSTSGDMQVMAKPYFAFATDGELELHHSPVPKDPISPDQLSRNQLRHVDQGGSLKLLRRIVNRLGGGIKALAQRISKYQPVPGYNHPHNPDWLLMKAILQKWCGEVESKTVIFPIPLYQFIEETSSPEGYAARFQELHSPPLVCVHDPLPELLRFPKEIRRGFRFKSDVHPTASLHQTLAEVLAPVIRSLL